MNDDEELLTAWTEYFLDGTVPRPVALAAAELALSMLQSHLAAHGFAIVRRMDPDHRSTP